MYEQTVRKRLRLLISKGLLFQRKTYGDGNTYYPIGEPWPYSGVSAQLGMNLSRSGVSSRNDPGSHPGRSGVSSRNDPYRENEFLTNEENEPPPNARALRATRAREGQGTAAVSQPKISQEFGEDLRDRERAIEALSEVLPPSQWHPAWADVVAREWLDVLDAFDDYKVDNPVGTLVRRLQKLAAEHDLTVPPADSLAGRGVPVKRQQKPLSYREYFRG